MDFELAKIVVSIKFLVDFWIISVIFFKIHLVVNDDDWKSSI